MEKVQSWLCAYQYKYGFGRFINYRDDGLAPSEEYITSMERKLNATGAEDAIIMSVTRLADVDKPEEMAGKMETLVTNEIIDFCAGIGHPGEPTNPTEMQRQLLDRILPLLNEGHSHA
ncbi:TPA: hypothetical protein PCU81_002436 [Staphylococcus aureus]|uniref:hypothetical protein n=1 Tax=Serratia marcescens TaxID=615 RepID=UPI000668A011|nr:hypothetical protein [Serratia marcescens]HDG4082630.1 hypothetical protein [Staphylococcus aureus]HEJ8168718.1 hypothetical protein [Serratia marcescens]